MKRVRHLQRLAPGAALGEARSAGERYAGRLPAIVAGSRRTIDVLEKQGFVEKGTCESDARVTYAHLTDAGLEKYKAARKTHLADIEQAFGSRYTPEELAAVSSLLGRLLDTDEPVECSKEPE